VRTLFLLVVASALMVIGAVAEDDLFVPANDVSFTVAAEHKSYKAGEQIYLKYEIVNVSNAPLYVPREWDAQCPSTPHIWASFENSKGKHFVPGYAGSCTSSPPTLRARMQKEAVLLKPGQRLEGKIRMDTSLFGGLQPGAYRLEALLSGWSRSDFDEAQRSELVQFGAPFVVGEVPASMRVMLTR
jgi:hypothetical protein